MLTPARRHGLVVAALWLLASALRLGFVLHLPDLPLYWDEKYYDPGAKVYAQAWQSITTPSELAPRFAAAFRASQQKGEAYEAFAGVIYALAGPRPRALFVAQALLDGGTCLFTYGIARVLAGPGAGLLALALAAVYPPFIFAAGRIQSETQAAFLCAGALWAFVRPWRRRTWLGPACAGLLLALTMLTRPAFQFLFPLWLPLAALVPRDAGRRRRVARCAAFAAGFFVLIGPRLVATDHLFGRPLWSGTTDPSINSYAGIVFDNLGWRTDHMGFNARGEMPEVLRERGHAEPDMHDYRLATARTWERHPLETAAVLLHKTYIVWRHPYNDSRRTLFFGARAQRGLHQAILLLAAIGLPLALLRWRAGVPLILTIFYCWMTYLGVQIEVRYIVTAVPLLIACAAVALVYLGRGSAACWRNAQARAPLVLAGILFASLLLLRAASLGRLTAAPFHLLPLQVYTLHRGLVVLILVEAAALVFRLLAAAVSRRWALAAALPCVGGALIFLVGGTLANLWHQWTCPLTVGSAVRQDFVLPASLPPPESAEVWLDLTAGGSEQQDLIVSVNGAAGRIAGGPMRDNAVEVESFYNEIFAGQGLPPRPWHAWYGGVLEQPDLLTSTATVQVEVRVEGPGTVFVFGDYPSDDAAVYDGPSPLSPESNADTSVYKYLSEGDFRMRRRYALGGQASSSYFDGHEWRSDDLSPTPGRQFGRYRIILKLTYPNGRVLLF